MKKKVIFVIANVLLISGLSFATEMKSQINSSPVSIMAPVGVWVKVSLTFHRPKLDCLRGFGFCFNFTWGIDNSGSPNEERGCPVSLKLDNNLLMMQVMESDLAGYEHGSTLQYFKGKSAITIEDYTELPPGITRELGSSTPIVIRPGSYPVSFENGVYTIVIQL